MIRQAATLMILRDTPDGPEVLLQRRGRSAPFMPGRYVFPGGVVEEGDRTMPAALVDTPDADRLAARVAAIRETFEESGVLLARSAAGTWADAGVLLGRGADLASGLARSGLVLAVGDLAVAARWITPEQEERRYDTLFFRAVAPPHTAIPDAAEMDDAIWIRPVDALDAIDDERMWAVPPTIENLSAIARFDRAEAAVRALDPTAVPDPIQPTLETRSDGSVWVVHESFSPYRLR